MRRSSTTGAHTISVLRCLPFYGAASLASLALVLGIAVSADSASAATPGSILADFSTDWNERAWEKTFPVTNKRYIRAIADRGWRGRFAALRNLVAVGPDAVDTLLAGLESKDAPTRVLAAQSLGYLAPSARDGEKLRTTLLRAAEHDEEAAVRLYAVDALGMQGGEIADDLKSLEKNERNRDVRSHIRYALERGGAAVEPAVTDTLANFDLANLDSAKVGKKAPGIVLKSVQGPKVRLSQFRGKATVVLVFIYGDT